MLELTCSLCKGTAQAYNSEELGGVETIGYQDAKNTEVNLRKYDTFY